MLLHHPEVEFGDGGRHVRALLEEIGSRLVHVRPEPLGERSIGKWRPANEEEIERAAEGVDVAATVGLVAVAGLLWREIIGRSEHLLVMFARQRSRLVAVGQGQPHVEDLHRPPLVEHEVGRLDVTVDEPLIVGVLEPRGCLAEIFGHLADIERPLPLHLRVKIRAVDVLEHDEVDCPRRLEVERPGDIGMIEAGRRLRFPFEAGQIGTLLHPLHRQDLDGHLVVEGGMFRQVDAAHAAGAEEPQQLVFAEDEALVTPLAELIDLPGGELPRLDEGGDEALRHRFVAQREPAFGVHPGRERLIDLSSINEPAGAEHAEKVVQRLRGVAHAAMGRKEGDRGETLS